MRETTDLVIGSDVFCSQGACGELKRVVVDPTTISLSHLIVEPKQERGLGRLVPIELVDSTGSGIRLRCTAAEFAALEEAQETRFVSGAPGQWDYQQEQMLSLPYYAMGQMGPRMAMGADLPHGRPSAIYDRVPKGDVEVRRGEHVHATDGTIGRVKGLVVDLGDDHITHVLLDEGHLWGTKRVAIPISAVTDVHDGIRLNLTQEEVRDLPPVDVADGD
jgi:sporulation protein YlmC with PRC-barrel domain